MNYCSKLVFGIRSEITKCTFRSTSKIAVEIEPNFLVKLKKSEIKPRLHPGIIRLGKIELPKNIHRALQHVIGDYPIKSILNDCDKLNQYISSRHPPIEHSEYREKMRTVIEEVDRRMPPEQKSLVGEKEGLLWRQKRDNLIKRLMAQRIYAWKPIEYGTYESLVYAIGRGAKEFGVLTNILNELRVRDSEFHPRSYFDFGSGVGSGMWAASNLYKSSIFEYYNVDSSRSMNDLSELILREGNENQSILLRNVFYRQFLPALETKYDLVVSAYTLFELPSAESRREVLLNLWKKCSGYMVVVEEGTRRGSQLVNEARDYVLKLEGSELEGEVFAPCAHNLTCPRSSDAEDRTPCNFEVGYVPLRVGDTKDDRHTALYSYVVLKKGKILDATRKWPRLVRPKLKRSKHVICRLCTVDAKLQEIIFTQSKHGRDAYRCARASDWGDRLPITLGGQLPTIRKTFTRKDKEENCNDDEK